MADRALRFDLLGRDRTLGRTLGQAEGRFKRFGGAALKMGAVISGAFAGIAIGGFLKSAIDEARDAQKVGRQTAAVLKATGGVAKVSARDVDRLSTALSNKAGVDDEVIASGANMLLTFKGIRNEVGRGNDIFNQASAVALDMTAALNQGEVSQSGLQKSTIQLGKALNDPIRGITSLTRVGVTFTQKQKDQIKALVESGRTMDAQKIILAELSSEFGGAAEAAADPWQRLGVVWGNLKEAFGTTLLPIVNTTVDWLSRSLPGAFEAFQRVTGPVVAFLRRQFPKALAVATDLFGTGRSIAGRLVEGVQSRFNEWRPSLVAFRDNLVAGVRRFAKPLIAALTVGVKTGNWEPLGRALGDAVAAALRGAGNLGAKVAAWLSDQFAQVDWHGVGKAAGSKAFGFAVGFVAALGADFFQTAREHPLDTVVFFASFLAVGKIGGVIGRLLSKIPFLRAFAPMFEGLNRLTAPLNNTIGRVLRAMGRAFARGLGLEGVQMGRAIARRFDGLRLRIWAFGEGFGRAALRIMERLGHGVRVGLGGLARATGAVVGALGRFLGRILGPVAAPFLRAGSNLLSRLVAGMRSQFGAISSTVRTTISRLTAPFRGSLRWLSGAGQNIIDGLISGMRSALGSIGGIVRDLKDAIVGGIKRLFGIRSPSSVMAGLGGHMIAGLVKGLVSNQGTLGAILKSIGGDITEAFAGMGGGGAGRLVGFARSAFGFFRGMFPGMTIGGWRARGSVPGSDHPKGKALDLMTTSGFIASAIIAAFRMMPGAKYWIWNRQIATASSGWKTRPYSGPSPHTDHVHLSFFDKGGYLLPGTTLAVNKTGKPERVMAPGEQVIDYRRLARAIVDAVHERPPNVYLDRQKVSRGVATGQLWEARR